MKIEIRKGTIEDIDQLEQLYDNLNDYLAAGVNYPGWKKGVYPIREDAECGIEEDCLYVAVHGNEIAGSMILRNKFEPAYLGPAWKTDASEREAFVISTFVVNPEYLQCGIGQQMLEFAAQLAAKAKMKSLRLDVYEKNVPAIRLYKKCGFQYVDTVSLGLEKYGLDWFYLYEKVIKL